MTKAITNNQTSYWKSTRGKDSFGFSPNKSSYKVKSGDYLGKIAAQVKKLRIKGNRPYQLFSINDIIDAIKKESKIEKQKYIHPGQVLKIPEMFESKVEHTKKLTGLEKRREDFYNGRLNKLKMTYKGITKANIEKIFDAITFSLPSGSVRIKKGKTLTSALYQCISIKNNEQNKLQWKKMLKEIGIPMRGNLANFQKLYVSYKLFQWVEGF